MICVLYGGFSIPALIFITCIWVPLLQIKHAFLHFLSTLFKYYTQNQDLNHAFPNIYHRSDLQFSDLLNDGRDEVAMMSRPVDQSCSICLAEFRSDDVVSQLGRCRHVFHSCCIEGWLGRDQFTCPLCRSRLLVKPKPFNKNHEF
ncbi:Zinc finger, RING/FYVE/PHD-type [Cynara cardunculus var. scolymus]|uniref:Zinc finger, RING/FYVE/PHD-type n=1 Tax=Cynara cardunculus var. scolymus TaxID=59895 RepID=A0A103YIB6_CYNCS|nr:Zinc finger, RING/FYVE/PHD-type [Cynara cardunculus var. scolymus]